MSYDQIYSKPITVCLNDSIFKDRQGGFNQASQKRVKERFTWREGENIHQKILRNHAGKSASLEYINGSYFGKTNQNKEPSGVGIFIDDQFNFFLSQWKQNHTMNSLTLIMLLNGVKLYGSWIDGKPNGWNCIELGKGVKIFAQIKTSQQGKCKIQSPMIVINQTKKTAYLTEVELSETLYTKIQILNRKQIHQFISKDENKIFINLIDIFEEVMDFKIPHFFFSFEDFLIHLTQNIEDIEVKKIEKNSQFLTFISLKNAEKDKSKDKPKCFIPFPELLHPNQIISQKNNKKLGILLSQKYDKTKAIGQFSHGCQLSGRGITFTSYSSDPLFGIFKSDMLVKQLLHPEPFSTKFLQSCQLKKQLTQYHMKSVNFVHNFVYFNEVDSILQLMINVIQFVNAFEEEYSKRHGKEVDSFAQSQNQYEQGKYYGQEKKFVEKSENQEAIKENKFYESNNVFVKRRTKDMYQNSTQKLRPFGKIVNSRSPLRQIPNHSHSKSPSQIETYRQRNAFPSTNIIDKSSHKKDLFISIKSFSSYADSKYNVKTTKNKSKDCNQKIEHEKNKKPRYFLAHNHQEIYQQKDVMETIRIKDESKIRAQHCQNQIDKLGSNLYSRHLRNNYIKKK